VLARVDDGHYRRLTEIDRANPGVATAQVAVNESRAAANSNVASDEIGLFDAAFCLCAAAIWFQVPFRGSLPTGTTALFTLVVLGIGFLVLVRIRNQPGVSQVAMLLTMVPITLPSGFTFPIDQMPRAIQGVTLIVHARYYITILRAIFLKGGTLDELIVPVLALVEQIMVSPIRRFEFILGKTLPCFLIGLANVAPVTVFGVLWFDIPFVGNPFVRATSLFL
jgi:ABC-type multidrug transport system permease subunit